MEQMDTQEAMEYAESRLKCFLHYGSEERIYVPNGNLKYSFEPRMVGSIEQLLADDEWANKIVPIIQKVNQCHTSIEPAPLLYALAMVIRKARIVMDKRQSRPKTPEDGDKSETNHDQIQVETKPKKEEKSECESQGGPANANTSISEQKKINPTKWDLVIREAYKAARKLSDDKAENLFMFTYYLREIAKKDGKKGFGNGWRKTIDKWYEYQPHSSLAKSVTKFYSNLNWTHYDLLTLRRWKSSDDKSKDAVLLFAKYNFSKVMEKYEKDDDPKVKAVIKYLKLINDLRHAPNPQHALEFVANPDVTVDLVPPIFLEEHTVWLHLIPKTTPEQLLSLLNRLSRLKMFKHAEIVTKVVAKFEELNQPGIHPIHVFVTKKRYEEGPNLAVEFQYLQRRRVLEESGEIPPPDEEAPADEARPDPVQRQPPPRRNQEIIACLNNVFVKTISSLAPTGRRFLIGLDAQAANASRRCLYERFVSIEEAALLVSLCVLKAETSSVVKLVTFTKDHTNPFREVAVCRIEETMDSLKSKIHRDDCVTGNVGDLIQYATKTKEQYDVFIVLGDNMLQPGGAYEALKTYRREVNPKAKVVTCCFIGRHKKYKDLIKDGMLLICGFDRYVGVLIQSYSRDGF